MSDFKIQNASLAFERSIGASTSRVFALFADFHERTRWGKPSATAVFEYDEFDFRVGGQDVFRCGPRENPEYRGIAVYQDIQLDKRICWVERIEIDEAPLMVALMTVTLHPIEIGTSLRMLAQVVSFAGERMIEGTQQGNNAALDNLVAAVQVPR